MSKVRQPNPITEGWKTYRKLVDDELKKVKTHTMVSWPHVKCLTHKDCHLDSFYPGKLYRAMKMKRDKDGHLVLDKSGHIISNEED